MKTAISAAVILAVVLGSMGSVALLTGCQTPGREMSLETGSACPMCKTQTVASPIKGLTVTKHVCPGCKNVSTIDPAAPASMRDYVDPDQQTIHVCEHCKAAVSKCPLCRKQ